MWLRKREVIYSYLAYCHRYACHIFKIFLSIDLSNDFLVMIKLAVQTGLHKTARSTLKKRGHIFNFFLLKIYFKIFLRLYLFEQNLENYQSSFSHLHKMYFLGTTYISLTRGRDYFNSIYL